MAPCAAAAGGAAAPPERGSRPVPGDDPLVVFTPSGRRGRFPQGTPVLAAARSLGVDLDTVCGGRGICGRCQVQPARGRFPKHGIHATAAGLGAWNRVEERYRSRRGLAADRRLGCQATLQGDMVIDVPPESQVHRQVVRKSADRRPLQLDVATRLRFVTVAEPDMHHPSSDASRLQQALREQWGIATVAISHRLLPRLQGILRQGKWSVTCVLQQAEEDGPTRVLELWPGFREAELFGLAVDVGSTTIACHLTSLEDGGVRAATGAMNPQIRFGEDLMSRVSYAMLHPEGAGEMTAVVREAIDRAAGDACREAGIGRDAVFEATLVGNPVMHHLLLGIDPGELGGAPFALAVGESVTLPAAELGLALHRDASARLLPCIAGHVGADAAAVILAEAPHRAEPITLVIDVGTNAELILGNRERLLACSSPTGPAFEGAQISSGQRAAPGAIERVRIDPATLEPRFRVIGSEIWSDEAGFDEAVAASGVTGICGSGIIEAIAEMRLAGIVDEDGRVDGRLAARSDRIRADGRTHAWRLHQGPPEILVTQNDVRAIQLAKAALYAGARLLMDHLGVESVERVVLAGAFGAHISPLHAAVLGMIPDCPLDRVHSVGNAAGTGARIALVNRGARREIDAVVGRIEKVETAVEPRFQEHFVAAMAIPHKTAPRPHLEARVRLPVSAPGAETGRRRGGRRRARAATDGSG